MYKKTSLIQKFSLTLLLSLVPFSIWAIEGQNTNQQWIDETHNEVKSTVNSWANSIDNWFDKSDPNSPATASLRIMFDNQWNQYDGYSIKPRIRAKLRLPALKRRFSLVFGDESLEDQNTRSNIESNYINKPKDKYYSGVQTREDNSSLALRWSTLPDELGVDLNIDVGIRSGDDLYLRFKGEKTWQLTEDYAFRFEQIYRYGIDSKHYLRSNFELKYDESDTTFIMNQLYLQYTNNLKNEEKNWGNSLYRQHNFKANKRLAYGVFAGGDIKNNKPSLNRYGPFITYRQPIYRQWLFIQPELNFYNDKKEDRRHYIGAFLRIEAIF